MCARVTLILDDAPVVQPAEVSQPLQPSCERGIRSAQGVRVVSVRHGET